MTSPNVNKPSQTTKDYEEVHSRGSSFGQGLSEDRVREILGAEVRVRAASPVRKAVDNLINGVVGVVADGIRGLSDRGAHAEVISGAVDDRMMPIESSITENTKHFTSLSDRLDDELEKSGRAVEEARSEVAAVASAQERLQDAVREATNEASTAVARMDLLVSDQGELKGALKQASDNAQDALDGLNEVKRDNEKLLLELEESFKDVWTVVGITGDQLQQLNDELDEKIEQGVANSKSLKDAHDAAKEAVEKLDGKADAEDLDQLQTNAIKANQKVGSTNKTAIQLLQEAAAIQKLVNDKQAEWNEASSKAVKANRDSIRALARRDKGQSLVLYNDLTDEELDKGVVEVWKPVWANCTTLHKTRGEDAAFFKGPAGFYATQAWGVSPKQSDAFINTNVEPKFMRVEEGRQYKLTYWHKADVRGSKYFFQGGSRPGEPKPFRIVEGTNSDGGPVLSAATTRFVPALEMSTVWERVEVVIQIEPGVTGLSLNNFFWNRSSGYANAHQWIANLDFGPNVPSQAQVDDAQNKAIAANTSFVEAQHAWNETATTATRALSRATKLLGREEIPGSLERFIPPTEEELADPNAVVDWYRPGWAKEPDFELVHDKKAGFTYFYNGLKKWCEGPDEDFVSVIPNQAYEMTFYANSSQPSRISFELGTNPLNPEDVVESLTLQVDGDPPVVVDDHSARFLRADTKVGWRKFKFVMRFKQGVKRVGVRYVIPNDTDEGGSKWLWVKDFRFRPAVPDQAVVDEAQNKAIEANRYAIQLNQEMSWANRDMIELLDIQRPRVFYHDVYQKRTNAVLPVSWRHRDHTSGTRETYTEVHDWYRFYVTDDGADTYVTIGFHGVWDGVASVDINWDNGVVDQYTFDIRSIQRIISMRGGALHIGVRSIRVELFVTNLRRKVRAYSTGVGWSRVEDPHGLVRDLAEDRSTIRMKNMVTCDRPVHLLRGDGTFRKIDGKHQYILYPEKFYPNGEEGWFNFHEYHHAKQPSMDNTRLSTEHNADHNIISGRARMYRN